MKLQNEHCADIDVGIFIKRKRKKNVYGRLNLQKFKQIIKINNKDFCENCGHLFNKVQEGVILLTLGQFY